MEDEGFVDDDFIEETAWEYVGRYGLDSISVLQERADIAEVSGHPLLAQALRDMVDAAKRIIGSEA